jgi:xanthine dehydrogenase YagT iron-sulfur-binding subunit
MLFQYNLTIVEKHENHADDGENPSSGGTTRRGFLSQLGVAGAGITFAPLLTHSHPVEAEVASPAAAEINSVILSINGKRYPMDMDSRVTLLDALRERLGFTGTKKGCDHGQCGACTVLVDGRRINSCLHLTVMCDGAEITTIEGLAKGDELHPMQAAFLKHDGFQCGYCTPGQICSAVGLIKEGHAHTDEEIKEQMSGNICRCGAYNNILDAIKEVQNA